MFLQMEATHGGEKDQIWIEIENQAKSLQFAGLENSMGRGAWQATVHGAAKSQTRLSDWAQIQIM